MPSITPLITKLCRDYSHLSFQTGPVYKWNHTAQTIFYPADDNDSASLLHELAHAALHHQDYRTDIELIRKERDAWEYAKNVLGPRYTTPISADAIEEALDTYRDWLHARSICPKCSAVGIQMTDAYQCVACDTSWQSNEAKHCALRRYTVTHTKRHRL